MVVYVVKFVYNMFRVCRYVLVVKNVLYLRYKKGFEFLCVCVCCLISCYFKMNVCVIVVVREVWVLEDI